MKFRQILAENDPSHLKCWGLIAFCGIYNTNDATFRNRAFFRIILHLVVCLIFMMSIYKFLGDMEQVVEVAHHVVIINTLYSLSYNFWRCHNELNHLYLGFGRTYEYESPLVWRFTQMKMEKFKKIMDEMHKYMILCIFFGMVNFLLAPLIDKYVLGAKQLLLFKMYSPLSLDNWSWYLFIIGVEFFIALDICLFIFGFMLLGMLWVLYMYTQFEILQFALEHIQERIEEAMDALVVQNMPQELKHRLRNLIATKCMNDCAKHHLDIINYFQNAQECLKMVYMWLTAAGIFLYITTGLVMILDNNALKIKFIGFTFFQVINLWIYCYKSEIISQKSQEIRLSLYNVDWWELPLSAQSTLRLILVRTFKPLYYVSSMGNAVSLETYADMLSASYTYFNMLVQLYQRS